MEQKDSAKEQGEGPALSCFCSVLFYSKVKMVAKKEETSPDSVSFCFFLNQAIQYYQEFLALKSGGGLVKRCACPCSGVKVCSKVPAF